MLSHIEVCPIELPGRGIRLTESPFTSLPTLIETLARALIPLLNLPFAFFGHSLGALVSFELARHFRDHYRRHPVCLLVSAARTPQLPLRGSPINALPEVRFLTEPRRLNGTPGDVLDHAEFMNPMLPALRADFALFETYTYASDPPLDCPILAFGGLHDQRVSERDLLAWSVQTGSSFSVRMVRGDHFLLKESHFFACSQMNFNTTGKIA
jgi:medium-chain acyl-[acyl-carrier-protein] hydrolase